MTPIANTGRFWAPSRKPRPTTRERAQQQNLIDQVVSALTAYITEAQRGGTADPALDANRTARWLIWMIERGLYQLIVGADADETERLLDALTDIVWRVIYRR